MLFLIVTLIFIAIIASTWWFGLWSNFITLINLLLSGLIASSFFEDLANKFESMQPTYRSLWDFVSIWLLFAGSFFLLRGLTDTLSAMRLRFDPITELVGRSLLSIWIACVFVAFTLFTFHLAPLPPTIMSDTSKSTIGVGPDKMWAAFIQSRSRGALSVSKDSDYFGAYDLPLHPDDQKIETRVFDPYGKFIQRNLVRRQELSQQKGLRTK
jgi:hypothetical protein